MSTSRQPRRPNAVSRGLSCRSTLRAHLGGVVGLLAEQHVVVRRAAATRLRQIVQHLSREAAHRDRRARGIRLAGQRIAHIDGQDALPLRQRRDGREHVGAARLLQHFEVGEEERAILENRPAQHTAELVAIEAPA